MSNDCYKFVDECNSFIENVHGSVGGFYRISLHTVHDRLHSVADELRKQLKHHTPKHCNCVVLPKVLAYSMVDKLDDIADDVLPSSMPFEDTRDIALGAIQRVIKCKLDDGIDATHNELTLAECIAIRDTLKR